MKNNYFIKIIRKQLIRSHLKSFHIFGGYEITDDLIVNFKGDLNLTALNLKKIPFKIGAVNGNFDCSENKLKNLINGPDFVTGDYRCDNNRLNSLEGIAKIIPGDFDCSGNNLKSLSSGPYQVGKSYRCNNNKLEKLHGIQNLISGDFWCQDNKLGNLEYCPKIVNGIFCCEDNPIEEWKYLPEKVNIFRYTITRNGPFGTLEDLQEMNKDEKIKDFYQELDQSVMSNMINLSNNKKRLKI